MHLAAALFEDAAGLKLLHVPYKGGGPAIQDVIGGHTQMAFATVLEVPTIAESGLPGYNSISWIGVLAPAGSAPAIVEKIAKDVIEVVLRPDVREKLIAQGAIPVGSSPAEFTALIAQDKARYARIIAEKHITAE
jgi:tripartite-type tricarboxylate transporter receptor subunit TctC